MKKASKSRSSSSNCGVGGGQDAVAPLAVAFIALTGQLPVSCCQFASCQLAYGWGPGPGPGTAGAGAAAGAASTKGDRQQANGAVPQAEICFIHGGCEFNVERKLLRF